MIDKDIINTFVKTGINPAKESKSNDNFFTRSANEIIPEYIDELKKLNLNFNDSVLPETATKTFST